MSDSAAITSKPLNKVLKMAVMAGVASAVKIYIERGDDLNARDGQGMTPLMLAAGRNKPAICKMLMNGGADDSMVDSAGRNAWTIAVAAGAREAAEVIKPSNITDADTSSQRESATMHQIEAAEVEAGACTSAEAESATGENSVLAIIRSLGDDSIADAKPSARDQSESELGAANVSEDQPEFDLSGWVSEEELPPPESDTEAANAAVAIQAAISKHKPIDTWADWDDFDAFLPERSSTLPSADDADARALLRLLLLRAIREGSVPAMAVEDLAISDDRSANVEVVSLLTMVINDLGAETDERFECTGSCASLDVQVDPAESPDEEVALVDALEFIDDLVDSHNDPLRLYQREFQKEKLLTGDQEVELGKAMESALDRALDALAMWPSGIAKTLADAKLVESGDKGLSWMSLGAIDDIPEIETGNEDDPLAEAFTHVSDGDEETESDSQFDDESARPESDSFDFLGSAKQLASLPVDANRGGQAWSAVRGVLATLRLNRRFLLQLCDLDPVGEHAPAAAFAAAMKSYLRSRDLMATANLKLVHHLAKKGLYSEQPLADLIQEGNLGLLKAVDRYDWRRGFKFSTIATWWIRQHVQRYIADKCKTIRQPVHIYGDVRRIERMARGFETQHGRPPTTDEIAARVEFTPRKVASLMRIAPDPSPIHEICIDEQISIHAQPDFFSRDPMDIASDNQLAGWIDKFLSTLKPKEEQILRMRFGIGIHDPMTLSEIGISFAVTRERIRQIESKLLRKLKHPRRSERLSRELIGGKHLNDDEVTELAADQQIDKSESRSKPSRAPTSAPVTRVHVKFSNPANTDCYEGNAENDDSVPVPDLTQSHAPATTNDASIIHKISNRPPLPLSELDQMLAKAKQMGIVVDDDRLGPSGRVWVRINEEPDNSHRRIVRNLLSLGFECWPEGYLK